MKKKHEKQVWNSAEKPKYCCWVLTYRCMFKCRICDIWKVKDDDRFETSLAEKKRLVDSLVGFVDSDFEFHLSGGEPLIVHDLIELIRYIKQYGFKVNIVTNGWLANKRTLIALSSVGLDSLTFSLDSIRSDTHDALRGMSGSYRRLMQAFEIVDDLKLPLKISVISLICGANYHQIPELLEWVEQNSLVEMISFQAVTQPFSQERDDLWFKRNHNNFLWPDSNKKISQLMDFLRNKRLDGAKIGNHPNHFVVFKKYFKNPNKFLKKKRCNLGDYEFHVDPYGKMFFCNFVAPFGNIKFDPVDEVWNDYKTTSLREDVYSCKKNCHIMVNCFYSDELDKIKVKGDSKRKKKEKKQQKQKNNPFKFKEKFDNLMTIIFNLVFGKPKNLKISSVPFHQQEELKLKNSSLKKNAESSINPSLKPVSKLPNTSKLKYYENKDIPSFCLLVVHKKCNFRCIMCNMWKQKKEPDDITLGDMKRFVLDLKTFVKEPIFIHLIGGETLLWKHTTEMAKFITDNGFKTSITTNGFLIDEKQAKDIVASKMSGVFLSLDSLKEEKHDYIRGTKGAFKHVMRAIDFLHHAKAEANSDLSISITMTIMAINIDEVLDMVLWVDSHPELESLFLNVCLQPFDGENDSKDWYKLPANKEIWPQDYSEVVKVLDEVQRHKKNGANICNPIKQLEVLKEYFKNPYTYLKTLGIKCPRGDLAPEVNAKGDVSMCFYSSPLGNIKTDSIKDIWHSLKMQEVRAEINSCRKDCDLAVNCFYKIENITEYLLADAIEKNRQNIELPSKTVVAVNENMKLPRACLLTVTNSCNLSCKMCDLWTKKTIDEELSIEQMKQFVNSLLEFGLKDMDVHLIGGEPLIKQGVFDLIKQINNCGMRSVITTSGYPINENMVHQMVDSGLDAINFSMESLSVNVHNQLRGKPDAFERLMRAIDLVSKLAPNIKLAINTIILKDNICELSDIVKWVDEHEKISSIYFMAVMRPFGSDLGFDWYKTNRGQALWPIKSTKVDNALDTLIAMKGHKGSKIGNSQGQLNSFKAYFKNPENAIKANGCNVQNEAINVNAKGDAYLCFFKQSLGNIKHKTAMDLWFSGGADIVRKQMKNCSKNCELVVNCYYED